MEIKYDDIGLIIFHGLGDVIFSTIVVCALRKKYPDRKITIITAEQYKGVFYKNTLIDEIISIKGNPLTLDSYYKTLIKEFKTPITPAPYISGYMGDTLCSHWQNFALQFTNQIDFTPSIFITKSENKFIENWIKTEQLDKFILLESKYGSNQSWWKSKHTKLVIELLQNTDIKLLFLNENPSHYNNSNTIDARLHFRLIIPLHNKSLGFIGVSSSLSVAVQSNNGSINVPHIECVKGIHWSTHLLNKKPNKTIITNEKELLKTIQKLL